MLISLVGLLLSFSVVLHLWTIGSVYRQKLQSLVVPLFIYLNVLIVLIELCSIFFLQENPGYILTNIFKIRFIAQAFIPPILFHLNQNYSFGTNLPKFNFKNIFFFAISIIFSAAALSGVMIDGIIVKNGMTFPKYTIFYLLFIVYFYATFYYLLIEFIQKYHTAKRRTEIINMRDFIIFIIPVTVLAFSCLNLLPFAGVIHPALFLCYPLLSIIVTMLAFRFNLLDFDNFISNSISFFLVSLFYIALLSFIPFENRVRIFSISIPVIIIFFLIFYNLQDRMIKLIKEQSLEEDYNLEEELESFLSEVGKYFDRQDLAKFLGDFSRKVLRAVKCAVVASRFDIKPYESIYLDGFSAGMIDELLSHSNSPILETLETDRLILNKFDHPPQSSMYQAMNSYNLYLGIPMLSNNNMMGFIFLGGDRKRIHFTKKDLRFARFLSVQAANAMQNVQAIEKTVQVKKMADLGLMASQLAHDFQSFITLTKLEVPADNRLRHHANYMEKLVRDLLNYTRPQDLRLAPVNLNQLIDMSLDLVNFPENIVIEKHYSDSIPEIRVDNNEMRRVFLNLFENSTRAMSEGGGRIKITTRPLRPLSKVRHNPWIYIEILDEGAGIPEEFLEKIFEPFFTTFKQEGGNGMGLAMVRQIITRHKGFIDVTSKLGKGTIFNIRLPYLV